MKNASIWNEILAAATKEIDDADIEKWLKPLSIKELRNDLVTLSAPNRFYKTWAEDKYANIIKKILKEDFSIEADIEIRAGDPALQIKPSEEPVKTYAEEPVDMYSLPLDKQYTFDNFVAGNSNRYAHAACVAAAKGFNNLYNPLYIYGDVGLGKTHLMQAVGNELRIGFPKLKILYTTGESYLNEYIQTMRNKGMLDDFKEKYRNIDVLLFDDVQTIVKGTKTQEEFFFMFSMLYATQKRIILTSNATPSEIPELDKRLSSRFSSGLMVDVQSPSVEEKIAIILKHLQIMQVRIEREVVSFIAESVKTTSVRDMIGLVRRLTTLAEFQKADITVDFAQNVLKDFLISRDRTLSPDRIVEIVASFFQLKPVDLKSKKRSNSIVYPRSIAMFLLREKTSLSLSEVGAIFDRDHSTVMTAVKKISETEKTDPSLKGALEDIRRKMKLACE